MFVPYMYRGSNCSSSQQQQVIDYRRQDANAILVFVSDLGTFTLHKYKHCRPNNLPKWNYRKFCSAM